MSLTKINLDLPYMNILKCIQYGRSQGPPCYKIFYPITSLNHHNIQTEVQKPEAQAWLAGRRDPRQSKHCLSKLLAHKYARSTNHTQNIHKPYQTSPHVTPATLQNNLTIHQGVYKPVIMTHLHSLSSSHQWLWQLSCHHQPQWITLTQW